jgi:threonine dehydrogenase-like Zn-dependent dehydrogenase
MQAVIGSIVAVSAFGAAYAANIMFPIEPIADADLLLNQSTMGTVNFLSKDSLKQMAPTPRDMITLYLDKRANLEDILDLITGKPTAKEAYDFLKTQEPTVENKFLIKACETHYGFTNIETQG